jgi:hypothetical protein
MKEMKKLIVIISNIIIFCLVLVLGADACIFHKTENYTIKEKILGKHITSSESGTAYYYVVTESGEQNVSSVTYMNVEKNDFLFVEKTKEIQRFQNINIDFIAGKLFIFLIIFVIVFFILRFTWLKEVEHFLD